MENNDGYIVEIVKLRAPNNHIETRYFYKNGKLHREAGPALVGNEEKEKYLNLGDEHLYKDVYIENGIGAYKTYFRVVDHSFRTLLLPSIYYLEGKGYSEKEFIAEQLKKEMPQNKSQAKKTKI
jgi:antitoxin component YwqK of YwqJK toxin-antitoxin module